MASRAAVFAGLCGTSFSIPIVIKKYRRRPGEAFRTCYLQPFALSWGGGTRPPAMFRTRCPALYIIFERASN